MDLFEAIETLPQPVQTILSRFSTLETLDGATYANLLQLGDELAVYGYEFEFYLDCIPFNLKKIQK